MTPRHGPRSLLWLLVSGVVVAVDQWTKRVAEMRLDLHSPLPVLPGIDLTLTYNTGAAFSLLSGAGGWQRWFFVVLALVVCGFLLAWLWTVPRARVWTPGALALVLGGAVGNLWDRVAYGAVVDFVDVHVGEWHWPAFNVADSAICVGAGMLVWAAFRHPEGDR